MIIIGLTGGISTGKSTVSKQLKTQYHLPIVDADLIAREVVEPGKPAYKEIVRYFHNLVPGLLIEDSKQLNRPALGKAVFNNEMYRKKLNSIVHPAVRSEIAKQVIKNWVLGKSAVILDVPLLFETRLDKFCGVNVAVLCSEESQLERLMKRDNISEEDAKSRIAAQMPLSEKRARADIVIENNGTLDELFSTLHQIANRPPFKRPHWLTFLQWIPPIGALWAFFVYWKRGFAV